MVGFVEVASAFRACPFSVLAASRIDCGTGPLDLLVTAIVLSLGDIANGNDGNRRFLGLTRFRFFVFCRMSTVEIFAFALEQVD